MIIILPFLLNITPKKKRKKFFIKKKELNFSHPA